MRSTLRLSGVFAVLTWVLPASAADPAYFEVHGLKAGDALTVHASASDKSEVVGELAEGTVVHNLGCQEHEGTKWCNVTPVEEAKVRGWVEHRYLLQSETPTDQQTAAAVDEATGEAECKIKADPTVTSCFYASTLYSDASATVVLTFGGGQKRILEYQKKRFHPQVGDESVATERKGDHFVVSVNHGAEVFHIPATAVQGGGD